MSNKLNNQLCGLKLEIQISDPWDFCDKFGTGPFYAKILKIQEETQTILLMFDKSFEQENNRYIFFSASIRHQRFELKQLLEGQTISLAFLSLSEDHLKSQNPFDTSWWRGGGVRFIGTAKIVNNEGDDKTKI